MDNWMEGIVSAVFEKNEFEKWKKSQHFAFYKKKIGYKTKIFDWQLDRKNRSGRFCGTRCWKMKKKSTFCDITQLWPRTFPKLGSIWRHDYWKNSTRSYLEFITLEDEMQPAFLQEIILNLKETLHFGTHDTFCVFLVPCQDWNLSY